ncbi:hypothetical protein D8674_028872 [Pyrus ussuriensis x Pyrus communis]|uniref:Uncharacterized protein n=1 Tax=Pyrus ussuriensis x Pyrus communis TaxID=2448454 RepID=A0A5N5HXI7_9ROSA|nr:hypothetical protein D8674_041544 [Pyrus ussuriensis x Pyrus communis]KAB2632625.1 hypothetical protein D8674_028872 [Pyrus ussuriensis x Pyrus communis]
MHSFPVEDSVARRWAIHHMESHQMFGRFQLNYEMYHSYDAEWGFIKDLNAWTVNHIKLTPSRIFILVAASLKRILTSDPLLIRTLPTITLEIWSLMMRVPLKGGQIVSDLIGGFFTRGVDLSFLGNVSSGTYKLSEVVFYSFHSFTQPGKPHLFFDL